MDHGFHGERSPLGTCGVQTGLHKQPSPFLLSPPGVDLTRCTRISHLARAGWCERYIAGLDSTVKYRPTRASVEAVAGQRQALPSPVSSPRPCQRLVDKAFRGHFTIEC